MAEPVIVNNPGTTSDSGSGVGFILGAILLIAFVIALFYYGLPYVRSSFGGGNQINVPDKVDVNINRQ
jgi:hypothetical protein